MIQPATYTVHVVGEAGEDVLPSFATPCHLPGVPRVGDDVKVVDGIRRVTRVLWQANTGNWVELWTTLTEPDRLWCPLHQHHKPCEHNGGVRGPDGYYEVPPS